MKPDPRDAPGIPRFDAVLLDLDGTLVDSAAELARAANRMLRSLGRPERSASELATYVGKGVGRLVHRSLTGHMDADAPRETFEPALRVFEACYEEESGRTATVYPGVKEGLRDLRAGGVRLACVTNKARRFTVPLLARIALAEALDAVIAGDDTPRTKPDPAPVLLACTRLGVSPARTLMIGDSSNDVDAARAAGCAAWCVPYGYNEGQPVEAARPDRIVASIAVAAQIILSGAGA